MQHFHMLEATLQQKTALNALAQLQQCCTHLLSCQPTCLP